ncbi:HYR-like domain-containing protein, partial [Portibacter marinus]
MFLFLLSPDVRATHFEGGNLSWQQAGGNSIEFSFTGQYRYGFFYNPLETAQIGDRFNLGEIDLGSPGSSPQIVIIRGTVTNFDKANDQVYFSWTFTQTYPTSGNRVVTAFYKSSAPNCCRDSDLLDGNNDRNFQLQTIVNVGSPLNNPPVTSLPSEINFPVNASAAILQIPASDPDNDDITYRIASPSESGLLRPAPGGLTMSPSGLISMNTVGRLIGQRFAIQVMIEDGKTKTPVDFTIAMVGPSLPPSFIGDTPIEGQVFTATPPGNAVDFIVEAIDPDANQTTSLLSVGLPVGATMTPSFPIVSAVNGSAQSTFSWTPAVDQVGTYVINFLAQDNVGIQAYRSVIINVLCPLQANVIDVTHTTCSNPNGGSITVEIVDYSDLATLEYLWSGPNFSANSLNISGLSSGIYNLRVDDSATGCFTNLSIEISDQPDEESPIPPSAPSDLLLLCADDVPTPMTLTATDNCDGNITVSPSTQITPGGCLNDFLLERTWTFTYEAGNSTLVTQTITVIDTLSPVAPDVPADLTLDCAADLPPPVNLTATDNCDGDITVSPDTLILPGSCLNDFTMVRTWTFTDTCGNTSSVSQTIIVEDKTAPVAPAAPADLTLDCAADLPPPVNLTA